MGFGPFFIATDWTTAGDNCLFYIGGMLRTSDYGFGLTCLKHIVYTLKECLKDRKEELICKEI